MNTYYVYILTNNTLKVLYTGVTNDLRRRIAEHKNAENLNAFTAKYKVDRLVYYEEYQNIDEAIAREKQIKGGSRMNKVKLILSINPNWNEIILD
jgi:putative endonuclease